MFITHSEYCAGRWDPVDIVRGEDQRCTGTIGIRQGRVQCGQREIGEVLVDMQSSQTVARRTPALAHRKVWSGGGSRYESRYKGSGKHGVEWKSGCNVRQEMSRCGILAAHRDALYT